jgi:hypothetical protein
MPAFIQLIVSNPAALAQAGTALQSAAQGFTATGQAFRQGMTTALANWQGNTRNRANAATERFVGGVGGMATTVREASATVDQGGAALQELVLQLRAGISTAQGAGFVVIPVGQVFPGPPHYAEAAAAGPGAPAVLQAYFAIARIWTTYFQMIVNVATLQDQVTARAIEGIVIQLDSQLPFRSSMRAPQWFGGSNTLQNNQVRGELGNQLNGTSLSLNGDQELGTEMILLREPGDPYHMRADRITLDADGGTHVYEAKTGGAEPTANQRDILPRLRYGGPEVGSDGMAPHLPQGSVIRPGQVSTHVERWDVDSLPDSTRDAIYRHQYSIPDILNGRAGPQARDELSRWMSNPAVRHRRTL